MKRYAVKNGSSFARYGVKTHYVETGSMFRGGIRL